MLVTSLLSKSFSEKDYKIYNTKSRKPISIKELAKQSRNYDVLFWGELHDDALIHHLEKEILPYLLKNHKRIAISMEMFERDTQKVLNEYLQGKISEKEFIKQSRAWPNYPTDYKPIIEFAKKHKIDVIAANVPRRYAAMINKKGISSFEKIPDNEKKFVAKKLNVLPGKYKKVFIETMVQNMGGGNSPMMAKMFDNIYAAQCLKDDTMAESINEYLKSHPGTFIIHYNGDFHSNSHLGTAEKLHLLNKKLKIAVISPAVIDKDKNPAFKNEYKDLGDYVLVMHRFSTYKTTEKEAQKMFKAVNNSIVSHKINLTMNTKEHKIKGFDEITLAKPISARDTLLLLSSLDVDKIIANGTRIPFTIDNKKDDYQNIIVMTHGMIKKLKIEYGGKIYFPLQGRNLNQTHDSTMGIISEKEGEGIYLPGQNWYPFMGDELADFDVTVSCPKYISLITSGKESLTVNDDNKIYRWTTELAVDNISLVGNKFVKDERTVNGVKLCTYLLKDDAKYSQTYLDAMEKYLKKYSKLFGAYPFSSFSVVENFFASGFGMPDYTVLAKQIVKMPFITLSPGVIAHEFCHNWWGNSVYVDYQKGNWCEALTVFSSNYYWNILDGNPQKAKEWRKSAIMEINTLPPEKNFPLKKFVYQHNDDEATIGYQKGAFLFITLYNILGKDNFFKAVKDYYKTYKGKIAYWENIRDTFKKYLPVDKQKLYNLDKFFDIWLNSTKLSDLKIEDIKYENGNLKFSIIQNGLINYQVVPIKINYKNSTKMLYEDVVSKKTSVTIKVEEKPISIELDPDSYVLKKLPASAMPYSLNRTLNDNPLVILPDKGELLPRLQMVVSMLKRSGYKLTTKKASQVTNDDLKNNTLLIFGSYKNNGLYANLKYPSDFSIKADKIVAKGKKYSSKKSSIILSYKSPYNSAKFISIYAWNSDAAITSFRKMFHYLNDSWFVFDLDKKDKGSIAFGKLFPNGENPFIYKVK